MWRRGVIGLLIAVAVSPAAVLAQPDPLEEIYRARVDLQQAFDATENHLAIPGSSAGFLINLEDWARQYGWKHYPQLSGYAPPSEPPVALSSSAAPVVGAEKFIVIDRSSGQVLAQKHADHVWPIASITKLMTTALVRAHDVAFEKIQPVFNEDNVGGARLWVHHGDTFRVRDLFYATLVGSANNAANALARSVGVAKETFVAYMNKRAQELHLSRTTFADPSGIEVANQSTAREVARLAEEVFADREIRRFTTTAVKQIPVLSTGEVKRIKNTNHMLYYPAYDDVYVMAGKTGYLDESQWNLVVSLRPELSDASRELLIVTLGSQSKQGSFQDSRALADWVWQTHSWKEKSDR